MRTATMRSLGAWAIAALLTLAAPARADAPQMSGLFTLCEDAAVVVDIDVDGVDDMLRVSGRINAVFVREDTDAGSLASAAPGDEFVSPVNCGDAVSPGRRGLIQLDAMGRCHQLYRVGDDGVLEDGRPDTVTAEEGGAAAVSDDCEGALADAGHDPPEPEGERLIDRLLGCASTKTSDATLALAVLAIVAVCRLNRASRAAAGTRPDATRPRRRRGRPAGR